MSQKEKEQDARPSMRRSLEEAGREQEAAEEPARGGGRGHRPSAGRAGGAEGPGGPAGGQISPAGRGVRQLPQRTAKEKESVWNDAKAETALAFLPVYDNLERALKQETADEAYKKGVEMTMNQLKEVLTKLGIDRDPRPGPAL